MEENKVFVSEEDQKEAQKEARKEAFAKKQKEKKS